MVKKLYSAVDGVNVCRTASMGMGLAWRRKKQSVMSESNYVSIAGSAKKFVVVALMNDPQKVAKKDWMEENNLFDKATGNHVVVGVAGVHETTKELPSDVGILHRDHVYYDRSLTKTSSIRDTRVANVRKESEWYRLNHSKKNANVSMALMKMNRGHGIVFYWNRDELPPPDTTTDLFFNYGDVPDHWDAPLQPTQRLRERT